MRWRERTGPEPDKGLLAAAGGNRFLAAMFARRGLLDRDAIAHFIDPARYKPSPADLLPGMSAGVVEIETAINDGQRIAVWGDFDVDGQTATTVLVDGLRGLGADVIYHIPERATESHGLNLPKLAELIRQGARLLVTCDTGISAHAEIEYARKKGLRIVITDHHDLPEILPEAEAVINPKLLADHPLSSLPGVGVAYKLIEALYLRAGRVEEFRQVPRSGGFGYRCRCGRGDWRLPLPAAARPGGTATGRTAGAPGYVRIRRVAAGTDHRGRYRLSDRTPAKLTWAVGECPRRS